jgi:lysophospholipase L1-like esterase
MDEVFNRRGEQIEWLDSIHFGAKGHDVIANSLFEYLKEDIQ